MNKQWLLTLMLAVMMLGAFALVSTACDDDDDDDDTAADDDFTDDDETDDDATDDDATDDDATDDDATDDDATDDDATDDDAADDDATDDDATDDDATDDDATDDDATDDDATDDDDDDDDDDVAEWSCSQVADGMINTCTTTLLDADGVQMDESELVEWCGESEALYAKTDAVFWECMGDCANHESCDAGCFENCLAPADPGTGCGHTVHGIYGCDVVFLFTGTRYWIPEMDMQETCGSFSDPWDCYQTCVDDECDGSGGQGTALINCLNANCS